jgi:hypothetical protein
MSTIDRTLHSGYRLFIVSTSFFSRIAICAALAALSLGAAYGTDYSIDLTNTSASVNINGTIFQYDNVSSGSGSYTDMFRVQHTTTQQGYNYDGPLAAPFDQVGGVGIPHQLVTALPVVTIGGVQYIHLNFDANNADGLVLTDLRMYVNDSGNPVYVNSTANLSNLGTLVYDFNAGGANTLTMTKFKSGSGTDDMAINIPLSVVAGQGFNFNTASAYFFATFTNTTGGFEEFAIDKSLTSNVGNTLLPEARPIWGGASMAALGLVGMVVARRRKAAAKASE